MGKRRPEVGPWVQSIEWNDQLLDDGGGRRRSRYVIFCPRCGAKRLVANAQARVEIAEGSFTLLCAQCRLLT